VELAPHWVWWLEIEDYAIGVRVGGGQYEQWEDVVWCWGCMDGERGTARSNQMGCGWELVWLTVLAVWVGV